MKKSNSPRREMVSCAQQEPVQPATRYNAVDFHGGKESMSMITHRANLKFAHTAVPKRLGRFTVYTTAALVALLLVGTVLAQSDQAANTAPSSHVRMYKFEPKHGVDKEPVGVRTTPLASSPSGAHLTYYGGRVVSAMQVVIVLWGPGSYDSHVSSTGTPSMASFYEQILSQSTYTGWLDSEYNTVNPTGTKTNQHIGSGAFQNIYTITPSVTGSTVDDTQIQSEIESQINAGHLPAAAVDGQGNPITYYAIYFPPGITITQGGSSSCVAGGFCAYHGTIAQTGGIHELYYGVHPDMQAGSGCSTGCGTSTTFGNYTSVASHEMTETITDAEVGLATVVGPPLAWYDTNNGEIGDICNGSQTTYTACDGQTYTVQLEFSNAAPNGNACIAPAAASCGVQNDFSISASPASVSVTAGNGASSIISTAVTAGSAETVSLSVSGAPSGVTATLSPTSVTSGGSSTLSISTASTTAAGTYTLTVTGTAASGSHTTTVSLTVTASTTPDFTISASPATMTFTQGVGGSGTSTISTTTVGSTGTVSLSTSVSPAGPTASVSPTSIASGASATLTVTVGTSVGSGTYNVTVTGTEGSNTHATTIAVTVSGSGGGSGITNGGFESGNFTGWTTAGASETVISSGCHGGTYCAKLGSSSPTNGDSTASQTFTAPAGTTGISLWYKMTCPDTVTYDWAIVTLKDNTAGTTATLLPKVCTTNAWTNLTGNITAGHSYTLTLLSHDDDYSADPSFTLYDDVTLTSGGGGGGALTNGGFETGNLSGWTASGASESVISSGCHGGTYCARLGSTSPTNGDSTIKQTFTVPTGKSVLSFWFKETCPDTLTYDWAVVTLKDNTAGTTATLLAKTCTTNAWTQKTGSVVAGHSYTLTLTSHDDNYPGDATYTLFDDVILQ
jgi:hypothetical protein